MRHERLLASVAAASLLALAGASAQAAQFEYVGYGGFVAGSDAGFPNFATVAGTNNTNAGSNAFRQVQWGSGLTPDFLPSGAEINNAGLVGVDAHATLGGVDYGQGIVGSVASDGSSHNLGWLSHLNHVIAQSFDTAEVMLRYDLVLHDGDTFVHEEERNFVLQFTETPNAGPASSCDPADGSVCPDYFTYAPLPGESPTFTFSYEGIDYIGRFGAFSPSDSLGRFVSSETDPGFNTANFTFEVSRVPEPAAFALMGIGLLGLRLARKRARANAR